MAIIYSYPINQNILATDILVGSSTAIVSGKRKNQTKSFEIADLTAYFASVIIPAGGFVPYTGATSAVNLGAFNLLVNGVSVGKGAGSGATNVAVGQSALGSTTTGNNNTAVGSSALGSTITGNQNTAIGSSSMANNTTGSNNTAVGRSSLLNNNGGGNTSLGNFSLFNNTTGSGNTAAGNFCLYNNSTGSFNTAMGNSALQANTNASNNLALGNSSLFANTTGSSNVGVGAFALTKTTTGGANVAVGTYTMLNNTTGVDNTAVGKDSLLNNTVGFGNTAIGFTSLLGNTTGILNTAIGYQSGNNNTTGEQNVIIGYNTTLLAPANYNSIVIGATAIGSGENTVVLGNTAITTTRLRGVVQGGSFVKDGGTSSQYLMADGSVTPAIYNYNFSGSLTLTGTLTTTNLLTITIPANSLSNYLDLRSIMVQQSGTTLAGFQIRVWHNSVNDFNTATRIANYAFGAGGADLFAQMTRRFSIQSGQLFGFPSTPSSITGEGSNSNAALSIPFDTTAVNYLFVSIQLTNATDTATLRNINITS
jgi:hypothetical protein